MDNDITTYKLHINSEVTSRNAPTDITKTFESPGTYIVYEEVIDSKGLSDKSDPINVEVSRGPYIEQSAVLADNGIDIKYSVTLSKVPKAQLKVKKDGVLISTEEISDVNPTGADLDKTYSYNTNKQITQGKYTFEITSDNLSKTNEVEIPDYPITFTSTSIDSKENSGVTAQLKAEDKNPNENPISIDKATSLNGKAWLTLKQTSGGYDLKIETPYTYWGPYQVELELKNATGKLEKKILQGNITKETGIDYSRQPNDTTFNWYGSGRIVNPFDRQPISQSDVIRLTEVANGNFLDQNDTRLRDRCDVNGDGYVNMQDVEILRERVNGTRESLDGEWNLQPTRAKKESWFTRMAKIDKTNEIPYVLGVFDCNQFTDQTYINFHGVATKDIPKFLQVYSYDLKDNGRFNTPLEEVILDKFDSEGKPAGGHAMNAFIFANPSLSFENIYSFEPEKDHTNVKIGEDYFDGTNTKFYIRGLPILAVFQFPNGKKVVELKDYARYLVKNKIPTFTWMEPTLIHPSGK